MKSETNHPLNERGSTWPTSFETGLQRLIQSQLISIIWLDLNGNITAADDNFLNTLGYTCDDRLTFRQLTPAEHHHLDEEAIEKLNAFGVCAPYEKEFICKNGSRAPVLFGAALQNEEIVGFVVDLAQNRQTQERINHLAYHDALTNLPNQVLFKDRLKQAIALSRRQDQMHAVMLVNLDRFKAINDSLGYIAGDRVLQSVAQRLSSCVRESDTVARFGSDEFAILITHLPCAQDAGGVARAIQTVLDQAFLFDDQELFISASTGISVYPQDGRDTSTLLKNASAALDRAKQEGGNNYQFYTAGGTTNALKQLVLDSNMRLGLERGEFVVEYQPQVNTSDFQLVGMEALLRWQHPVLGLLLPGEFIHLAEESGLIIPVGNWVMRVACLQNQAWQAAGLEPMRLSVNFTARQFQQATFVANVAQTLKETGLDPCWLELELTESSIMRDQEEAVEKLHELRRMGIRIAIDDFGTGYSSLSYLRSFPIDTLKIDKSFIQDVCIDPQDAAIVQAIVTVGHALDLTVVAEGVETPEQLEYLNQLHCDILQGFLFSKSLSTEDFEALLLEQRRLRFRPGQSQIEPQSASVLNLT
jgi:diguanylate cyclase (GGDEF)-like protein/PAS domain S-box-containing protein